MAVDPTFGKNAFNTPNYLNESETLERNILTVLEGKPGFFPSIPELGMDIKQYLLYQDLDALDCDMIKVELVSQCTKFVDAVRDGTFDVQKMLYQGKPMLVFVIPIEKERAPQRLLVGATTNRKGELIYKIQYTSDIY